MGSSLFWWDEFFDPVGEEDHTNLVVVRNGRKREDGRNFSNQLSLETANGTKIIRSAHVDQQHHRQLPFFLKYLDKWVAIPGCYVPVDVADIVAELVLPNFTEGHTTSFEGAVVFAGKDVPGEATGFYLNFSDSL